MRRLRDIVEATRKIRRLGSQLMVRERHYLMLTEIGVGKQAPTNTVDQFRSVISTDLTSPMATHAIRLSQIFTPTFARAINAQLVHPASSQVVKPNELESALARPLHKAHYEPDSSTAELGTSLSYGLIMGHPFLDGNKRTGLSHLNRTRVL